MPHADRRRNQFPEPFRTVFFRVSWISMLALVVATVCLLGLQVPELCKRIFH